MGEAGDWANAHLVVCSRSMNRSGTLLIVALVAALAAARVVRANDSTAELATGGLIFVQNNHVEMRSEDLFVSAAEIRVRYTFFNKTDRNVTVLVAFPMPEVRIEHQDQSFSLPTDDPVNMLEFSTSVGGKPVETRVEQRVFSAGIDRTQMLRDLGVPLAPHLPSTNEALDRLSRDKWDELIRVGLAEIEEFNVGKGMQQHLTARWALQTTFYWEQTFPAGAETVIEHRYRPSVGETVGTELGSPHAAKEPWLAQYTRKYCLDKTFLTAVDQSKKGSRREYGAPFTEERIDYILKTGANWSGPIGDFRLVVDKGDPDNLVSYCGDGLKKISPTQFEMRKKDFRPEGNLSVLILKKMVER
jgi:hypothetical protein